MSNHRYFWINIIYDAADRGNSDYLYDNASIECNRRMKKSNEDIPT